MLKISDILREIIEENKLNLKSRAKENEEEALNFYINVIKNNKLNDYNIPKNIFLKLPQKYKDKYAEILLKYGYDLEDYEYNNISFNLKISLLKKLIVNGNYLSKEQFEIFPDNLKLLYVKKMLDDGIIEDYEEEWYKEYKKRNINENISDTPEYNVALGKVASEKARNMLRKLGVNFDKGSCSIAIGSIDDFQMNSYVRLIPYGDNIITPAQRETAATQTSSQTFNVYGSDLNFSPQSKGQNQQQSPQIGEQIVLSGVTYEWMGQQWNSVSQKNVWVDNNNNPYTGNIQMLNTQYVLNESKNKILNYGGFDYLMTNVGWATYNKNTGKTGIVVTKKTNKQPNQSILNMIWLKQNPIPNGYKLNYNANEYISTTKKVTNTVSKQINQQLTTEWLKQKSNNQQQNQTNQITNDTVLDNVVLKQGGNKILCELEFYQFNSNDINQPLNKGFNPRKIKPGELIKCKNTYYVKILSPNPNPQKIVGKPCEWGVIHITRLDKN